MRKRDEEAAKAAAEAQRARDARIAQAAVAGALVSQQMTRPAE